MIPRLAFLASFLLACGSASSATAPGTLGTPGGAQDDAGDAAPADVDAGPGTVMGEDAGDAGTVAPTDAGTVTADAGGETDAGGEADAGDGGAAWACITGGVGYPFCNPNVQVVCGNDGAPILDAGPVCSEPVPPGWTTPCSPFDAPATACFVSIDGGSSGLEWAAGVVAQQ